MSRGSASRRRARELALQALYAVDLGLRRWGRPPLHEVELEAPSGEIEAILDAAERTPAAADVGALDPERVRTVFEAVAAHFEAPAAAHRFAWELVSGVCASIGQLDERIAARARNWRVSRMAAVDRNVLRIGVWELGHTTAPPAVVIDEAVELARRYGSDSSPAFVNGVLDALAGDLRPGYRRAARAAGDAP